MNDTYDDGLVHSHNWAAEPLAVPGGAKRAGTESATAKSASKEPDPFDDGLVHGHDWARN